MNQQTTTQSVDSASASPFSTTEWSILRELRDRYQQHQDLFSAREIAYLRFQRWLYQTGRIGP
jgi:hypothetical protein